MNDRRLSTGTVGTTDTGKTPVSVDEIIARHAPTFSMVEDESEEAEEGVSAAGDTETASETDDTGAETEAASDQDETDESGDDEAKPETTDKTGIVAALKFLEENNPDFAKAVRSLQGEFTKRTADIAQFERDRAQLKIDSAELRSILDEVRSLKDEEDVLPEQTEPEEDDPFAEVPEAQRALFERGVASILKRMGVVTTGQLQAKELQQSQSTWVQEQNRQDAERFGERLVTPGHKGALTDDALAPETRERLIETRNRFGARDRGVTWGDIAKVSFYDDDVKAAEEKGYQRALKEAGVNNKTRVDQARKSKTVSGSVAASTPTRPNIYDPVKDKGNRDRVFERALRWAEQQHS